jgi:hypothetical protein
MLTPISRPDGRLVSNTPSAFSFRNGGTPTVFAAGVAGYMLNGRWGDCPGVSTDPSAPTTVWVLGEYAKTTGAWGMAVTNP